MLHVQNLNLVQIGISQMLVFAIFLLHLIKYKTSQCNDARFGGVLECLQLSSKHCVSYTTME